MVRKAPATAPRWTKMLARKRERFLHAEGKIELVLFLEAVLLGVGEHRVAQELRLGRRERGHVERHQHAVDADLRAACPR